MSKQWKSKQEKFLFCLAVTFLWGMIAHGYRFFNLDFSHDSLLIFQELDFVPMISVGRFMQPVYFLLRGNTYAPALVGFLALAYIGVSVYWTAELLGQESRGAVGLLSGVMTANIIVTLTSATYIHDLDIYMLALLLAVWSVVICRKGKYGFLLAVIPTVLSLGLYQSYIQVAIVLHMMLAVLALLRKERAENVFAEGVKAVASLVIAMVLYYVLYHAVLNLTFTAASTDYNSVASIGLDTTLRSKLHDLAMSVYSVFSFFMMPPASHDRLVILANIAIFGATAVSIFRIILAWKIRGKELALLAALLLLMPFAINLTCFLAQGMVHHIMMYAYVLLYVFGGECYRLWREMDKQPSHWLVQHLIPVLLSVILLDGVIYSNQVYLKKSLEYNNTMLTMNRILDRIEQTDGYVYGETPVAFVGSLYDSPMTRQAGDFDYLAAGLWHSYAVSFPASYEMYIHNVLNYDMEILSFEQTDVLSQSEAVENMGVFPARNSVQMVDEVLVVKLSENTQVE